MLADTTAFAELKEPKGDIDKGEEILQVFRLFCLRLLQRSLPTSGARLVLAFMDVCCRAHPEQCSIAEFSANMCRAVAAHVDLAAEARSRPKKTLPTAGASDESSASDACSTAERENMEFMDLGGGDADAP